MQTPKPCNPYHAVVRDRRLVRQDGTKTAFKVYLIDIVGRAEPARTEWDKSGIDLAAFLGGLGNTQGLDGVGFVTAFPHITKAFRFGPESEIVANVRAWNTPDMSSLDLARSDGYVEFACLAEAALAADEFGFWAAAESVERYLEQWSRYAAGGIMQPGKLRAYWS